MLFRSIEKVKGMLLDPTGTYQNLKDEDMGAALRYFVIWLDRKSVV